MRIALSIYTPHAYKEILLPAADNTDYAVNLSRNVFGIKEDLPLRLEVLNQQWKFKKSKYYSVWAQNPKNSGKKLERGDVLTITNSFQEKIAVVVTETENPLSVFKKYDISYLNQISIGTDADNLIQYQLLSLVSRHHALLKKEGEGWAIEDISSNGVFLNEKRLQGSMRLQVGDCISIYGLKIIYLDDKIAIYSGWSQVKVDNSILPLHYFAPSVPSGDEAETVRPKQYFNRSPRNVAQLDTEPVEIEGPPAPRIMAKRPLFMIIGPSFTMAIPMLLGTLLAIYSSRRQGAASSAFMYTGIITVVGAALLGVFWALVNIRYTKKLTEEEENKRFLAYSNYLVRRVDEIKGKYDKSREALLDMYPSAETCLTYGRGSRTLWERNRTHKDFLEHRLGIGTLPFQVPIQVPKERFTLIEDGLMKQPEAIKKEYESLLDVPVRADLLNHRLIGLLGGETLTGALNIMRILSAQIAANNCYTDVKLVYIYDGRFDQEEWSFAKWLPHVWSENRKSRYVASNKEEISDVFYELVNIFRMRTEENRSALGRAVLPKPYYVMFISDPALLEGELISKYIYECREQTGLTTIIMAQNYDQLPNACEYIIEDDDEFRGSYVVTEEERQEIVFDHVGYENMEEFSRRLFGIEVKEMEKGGDIPNSLTFFDMFKINHMEELNASERWKKNRNYDTMRVPVGMKAGGELCYLDVHEKYHGPHGLVAGTTGSGKSETLQSYILSLALNYSPDDVNFFVIDYKGGGMANLFEGLPHMIGQISNLSGNQVRRAMVSIKSENKRRQKIFNENNVNNINSYTKLYKSGEAHVPVPHLFIIIDEFAELKREESEFMKELISVAQVGRSLGVHLILATQKPSGTVDDNIWSNSKFRLCLRVQDRQDSNDMLHKPDAAYITQAGRCYLQVGNDELYELFQSAWSGAAYNPGDGIQKDEIATMISLTGQAALTGSNQKRKQQAKARFTWIYNLLQITLQAASDQNQTIQELAGSSQGIDAVYEQLRRFGEDYPRTEYNTRRLDDLLKLYVAILAVMPEEERADLELATEKILEYADMNHMKLPEQKTKTQLDAVVEYLASTAMENGFVHKLQLWLPPLPSALYLEELGEDEGRVYSHGTWPEYREWSLNVPVGLLDDPVSQAQLPLFLDFAENGHYAVCGVVVSGKSTFLQTMIYGLIRRYSPEYMNLYAIDYSSHMLSSFEQAPHTGGIIYEDDVEKTAKLFHMLEQMLETRKRRFKGGNYSQFVKTNGVCVPAVILVIDNYGSFREKTENRYDDVIMHIAHDGVGYGIFLVLAAGGFSTTEIQSKVGDNIKKTICLQMNDKFQYSDALRVTRIETMPEANVKGRGLAGAGGKVLEFQTALSCRADNDYARMEIIENECMQMRESWKGRTAKRIPVIPEKPVWAEYQRLEEVQEMMADDRHLPMGYNMESADIYGIDLSGIYCYLLSGRARTGKTNLMKLLMQACVQKGGKVWVIEHKSDELISYSRKIGAGYIGDQKSQAEFFQNLIEPIKKRNGIKRALMEEGKEDTIYEAMKTEEKYFIFIADIAEFVQSIMNPEEGVVNIRPFVENITEKGSGHNIYFFIGYNPDKAASVLGIKTYENMTGYHTGIHLGGNVNNVRALDFSYISYTEQSKTRNPGIGMLPAGNNEEVRSIVIPLVKAGE